jgi:hypothetical protein
MLRLCCTPPWNVPALGAGLTPPKHEPALGAGLLYWDMVRVYTDHIPIPRQNR